MTPFREAGLPRQYADPEGHQNRFGFSKGVVRAVYPEVHRVDIEPDIGGRLSQVLVVGDILPEIHSDTENPQHAMFGFMNGDLADPFCFLLPFRRLSGPKDQDDGKDRRYYHKNQQIVRIKDITIRITPDNKIFLYDAESDDYCMYDMGERTFHVKGPHVFLGSDDEDRIELHTGDPLSDQMRVVIPKAFIGQTAMPDADGISYTAGQLLHLVSNAIKLTAASEIVLDPPQIKFGTATASEQLVLGNVFQTFLNAFLVLFNGHGHTNVQNGAGVSGPPQTPTGLMPNSTLSTIARVSQ